MEMIWSDNVLAKSSMGVLVQCMIQQIKVRPGSLSMTDGSKAIDPRLDVSLGHCTVLPTAAAAAAT
jgi:hypothetical protein